MCGDCEVSGAISITERMIKEGTPLARLDETDSLRAIGRLFPALGRVKVSKFGMHRGCGAYPCPSSSKSFRALRSASICFSNRFLTKPSASLKKPSNPVSNSTVSSVPLSPADSSTVFP